MPEVHTNDDEYLLTADLDDPVWSEEPVPDSWEDLCIHKIPRPETPTSTTPSIGDATPLQPDQVEMPPEMELDITEDMPGHLDVLEEVLLDCDAWAHSVLDYEW